MGEEFYTEEEIKILKIIFDIVKYENMGEIDLVKQSKKKLKRIINGEKIENNKENPKEDNQEKCNTYKNKEIEKRKNELTKLRNVLTSVKNKQIEENKTKTNVEMSKRKKQDIKPQKNTLDINLELKVRRIISCIQTDPRKHEDYVLKFLNYYGFNYDNPPFDLFIKICLICLEEDGRIDNESWKTLKSYMEKRNMLDKKIK